MTADALRVNGIGRTGARTHGPRIQGTLAQLVHGGGEVYALSLAEGHGAVRV